MTVVAVIPARHASTRFPGKPLCPILGRPMIAWVVEGALGVRGVGSVLVATDDAAIARAAEAAGARAVMTPPECPSGTDRVRLAIRDVDCDIVLNLQGDEPALDPAGVETLVALMETHPGLSMGTLVSPVEDAADLANPNVVKVALAEDGRCLYFSRSAIPHLRNPEGAPLWRHVGVYAFRKPFLDTFTAWAPSPLERAEGLEQLRALEHGTEIRAARVRWDGCGVDVPEDVPRAEAVLRARGSLSREASP